MAGGDLEIGGKGWRMRIFFFSSQFEISGCKKQVRWAQLAPKGPFAAPLLMQCHSRLTTVMHFLIQWAHPPQKCSRNRNNLPHLALVFSPAQCCVTGVDCIKCHAPSPLPCSAWLLQKVTNVIICAGSRGISLVYWSRHFMKICN